MVDGVVSGGAPVPQGLLTLQLWELQLGGEAGCRVENHFSFFK